MSHKGGQKVDGRIILILTVKNRSSKKTALRYIFILKARLSKQTRNAGWFFKLNAIVEPTREILLNTAL